MAQTTNIHRNRVFTRILAASAVLFVGHMITGCDGRQPAPLSGTQIDRRAQDRSSSGTGWWEDPSVVEAVGLTQDQTSTIAAMYADLNTSAKESQIAERRAAMGLLRALRQKEVRSEVVDKHQRTLEKVVLTAHRRKVERVLKLHEILSREQWLVMEKVAPHALAVGRFMPGVSSGPVQISADKPQNTEE